MSKNLFTLSLAPLLLVSSLICQISRASDPVSYVDGFETTLNPFWTTYQQNGTVVCPSTSQVHSGTAALLIQATGGGQKYVWVNHDFENPQYGKVTVWVYDSMEYIYFNVNLIDQNTNSFGMGNQDWDYSDYYFGVNGSGEKTSVPRSVGWHKWEVNSTSDSIVMAIDGQTIYSGPGGQPLVEIRLNVSGPGGGSIAFDDFSFVAAQLPPTPATDFTYTTNTGAITITGYTGSGGAVVIPDNINGLPVTGIEGVAFGLQQWVNVTNITIPDSVTNIGDGAFYYSTSLTSVVIPEGVTSIGQKAFANCTVLTNITIPANVLNLGNSSFENCISLARVTIPNGVTRIGDSAFSRAGLTGVTIPDSVTNIENYAFYYCFSLTNMTIGNGVISIGDSAFDHCNSLISVTIPNSVITIGNDAFDSCTSLTNATIGDGITIIGYDVFAYCASLPSITIPDNVTNIGTEAFQYCTGLTNVAIGNGVINIGSEAFYACSHLTSVTIPNSVVAIGTYAFDGCSSLASVTIPDSVTSIGDYSFVACGLTNVMFGNGITNIGRSAFGSCHSLPNLVIPASVTSIGYLAFEQCSSLTAIMVAAANSVYCSINGVLFDHSGTTLLAFPPAKASSYVIANGVTGIGDGAFYYCAGLTNVTIPDGVNHIGSEAFYECTGLKRIAIPDSVTNIGDSAFDYSGLISFVIGSGVTNIESFAFGNCSSLTAIYFHGNVPTVGSGVFYNDNNATAYYFPNTGGWSAWSGGCPAVLWNPQVLTADASFGLQANQFGFTITGSSNLVIVVEACTNLASSTWVPVGTNTLNTFIGTNGTSYFSDPQWTNYPGRFYHLRSP